MTFSPGEARDANGRWTVGVAHYLEQLSAVGFDDRGKFMAIFGKMSADKSLKNADLIKIAEQYGYGAAGETTRGGILKKIFNFWHQEQLHRDRSAAQLRILP